MTKPFSNFGLAVFIGAAILIAGCSVPRHPDNWSDISREVGRIINR
jgi:hypothetical protein